jgi:hypothetical protein
MLGETIHALLFGYVFEPKIMNHVIILSSALALGYHTVFGFSISEPVHSHISEIIGNTAFR